METREIPPTEWQVFLEQFSRVYQGVPTQVRTTGADVGVEADALNLPLIGLTDELAGQPEEAIRVMLGAPDGTHVDHAVEQPAHLRVAEWNDGHSAAIQIESLDGHATLIQIGPSEETLQEGMMTDDYS